RDQGVSRRALRRLRPLLSAPEEHDVAAVGWPVRLAFRRRDCVVDCSAETRACRGRARHNVRSRRGSSRARTTGQRRRSDGTVGLTPSKAEQLIGIYPLLTALLSDIHGNLEALNACLGHAKGRGAERFVFLGDLVGYGADARGVVEIVSRYAAEGAVVLKGNHDEAVEGAGGYFNDAARAAIE